MGVPTNPHHTSKTLPPTPPLPPNEKEMCVAPLHSVPPCHHRHAGGFPPGTRGRCQTTTKAKQTRPYKNFFQRYALTSQAYLWYVANAPQQPTRSVCNLRTHHTTPPRPLPMPCPPCAPTAPHTRGLGSTSTYGTPPRKLSVRCVLAIRLTSFPGPPPTFPPLPRPPPPTCPAAGGRGGGGMSPASFSYSSQAHAARCSRSLFTLRTRAFGNEKLENWRCKM